MQPVNVVGAVTASLVSTPACDDGQPFTLTASSVATGVSYSWFVDGNVVPNENTATLSRVEEGTYRVEVSKLVCTASAQMQVVKAPVPVGNLPNRVVICDDPDNNDPATRQVDLDPGPFSQYNWFKNELAWGKPPRFSRPTAKGCTGWTSPIHLVAWRLTKPKCSASASRDWWRPTPSGLAARWTPTKRFRCFPSLSPMILRSLFTIDGANWSTIPTTVFSNGTARTTIPDSPFPGALMPT